MGKNDKIRQKSLEKKKRKDKLRKKERSGSSFQTASISDYNAKLKVIKNSREFPIHECMVSSVLQRNGMGTILIARKQPDEAITVGIYLLDIYCLGLKSTFANANISLWDYENDFKAKMLGNESFDECDVRLAHGIIYGAIDYARGSGFEPDKGFKTSSFVLDKPSEADFTGDVKFGKDGKPYYFSGPDDDVDKILRKLEKNVGKGNFVFTAAGNLL